MLLLVTDEHEFKIDRVNFIGVYLC